MQLAERIAALRRWLVERTTAPRDRQRQSPGNAAMPTRAVIATHHRPATRLPLSLRPAFRGSAPGGPMDSMTNRSARSGCALATSGLKMYSPGVRTSLVIKVATTC